MLNYMDIHNDCYPNRILLYWHTLYEKQIRKIFVHIYCTGLFGMENGNRQHCCSGFWAKKMGEDIKKTQKRLSTFKRGIFWLAYYLFARHLPRSYVRYSFGSRAIRAFILKRLFGKFGRNVNIEPKVIFYNMSESEIGDFSGIGMYSIIGTVRIGRDVMMGEELRAISQNHKFDDITTPMRKQGWHEDQPIIVEDDVWIGARVIILPGIRIEKGSIIGAGTVVNKDIAQYSIAAGNPSKIIGKRNKYKKN